MREQQEARVAQLQKEEKERATKIKTIEQTTHRGDPRDRQREHEELTSRSFNCKYLNSKMIFKSCILILNLLNSSKLRQMRKRRQQTNSNLLKLTAI